jgi:pimeloyl-ACP methyl ester carboxylesterase
MIDNSELYKSATSYAAAMAHYDAVLAGWTIPVESRTVSTRYGSTHVLCAGTGAGTGDLPPLLLFHGWGANAAGLRDEFNLPVLTQSFRVFCPDTIGQSGRSEPVRPRTDTPAFGEWARDVVENLGLEHVYAAGISGGGFLALKLAAHAPERVIKAVCISPAGFAPIRPKLNFMLPAALGMLIPNRANVRRFIQGGLAPTTVLPPDAPMIDDVLVMLKHYKPAMQGPDVLSADELREITAPVHVMIGQHEHTFEPQAAIDRADRFISDSTTELVPDSGHIMTIDRQDLVVQRIQDMLK